MIHMAALEGLTDDEFAAAYDEAIESGDAVHEFHLEARRRARANHERSYTAQDHLYLHSPTL